MLLKLYIGYRLLEKLTNEATVMPTKELLEMMRLS